MNGFKFSHQSIKNNQNFETKLQIYKNGKQFIHLNRMLMFIFQY